MILYNYNAHPDMGYRTFDNVFFDVYGNQKQWGPPENYEFGHRHFYFIESYPNGSAYTTFTCRKCGVTYYTSPQVSELRCIRCCGKPTKGKSIVYLSSVPYLPEHIWGDIPTYWGFDDEV